MVYGHKFRDDSQSFSPLDSLSKRPPPPLAATRPGFSPQRAPGPRVPNRYPESPLLHTEFRVSTATSARDSHVDPSYDSQWRSSEYEGPSSSGLPLPPARPFQEVRQSSSTLGVDYADNRSTWRSDISSNSNSGSDVFAFRQYESVPQPPMLVISSPASTGRDFGSEQDKPPGGRHKSQESASSSYSATGRTKSIHGSSSYNFSRPFRPSSTASSSSPTSPEFSTFDQNLPAHGEELPPSPVSRSSSPAYPPNPPISILIRAPSQATQRSRSSPIPENETAYPSTSINYQNMDQPPSASVPTISLPSKSSPSSYSSIRSAPPINTSSYISATLPLTPPMTGDTTDNSIQSNYSDYSQTSPSIRSVYSDYSYYDPDSIASRTSPRGTPSLSNKHSSPTLTVNKQMPKSALKKTASSPNFGSSPASSKLGPSEYLQLGITHHENNKLPESASYFELSATVDGGCGFGMLMWGLTLRSGWGVKQDEKKGFKWLRRAAEWAVEDLEGVIKSGGETAKGGGSLEAVQSELVLAIYEVGQCFFHGWGVTQDKKMAVSYFQVAARLGDADAQQELGFCYANGKGCKKDKKEAAKWYRLAAAQGISTVGLAWIYKEKYS